MLLNINYLWEIKLHCFWIKVHVSSLVSKWLFGWVHSWNPFSFIKGEGFDFPKFFQKEEVVKTSSIKREGLVGFTYFHTNPFQYHLYICLLYLQFLSVFFVFQKKDFAKERGCQKLKNVRGKESSTEGSS